jgi:hypothetical protein
MRPIFKRPFAFWLPAFGLLFLLWSWADSRHYHSSAAISFSKGLEISSLLISSEKSCLTLQSAHISGMRSPKGRPVSAGSNRYKLRPGPDRPWFPMPKTETEQENLNTISAPIHSTLRSLLIPHWLIILIYLILCSIAFAWHHRRIQRHLTKNPSLPPAQPQADL